MQWRKKFSQNAPIHCSRTAHICVCARVCVYVCAYVRIYKHVVSLVCLPEFREKKKQFYFFPIVMIVTNHNAIAKCVWLTVWLAH